MTPDEQILTIEDRDNLSADMIVDLQCAERHMQMIELSYAQEIADTDEYRYLVKKHGKASVEAVAFRNAHKVLRNDERYQIGNLMQHIQEVHKDMQRIFKAATAAATPAAETTTRRRSGKSHGRSGNQTRKGHRALVRPVLTKTEVLPQRAR